MPKTIDPKALREEGVKLLGEMDQLDETRDDWSAEDEQGYDQRRDRVFEIDQLLEEHDRQQERAAEDARLDAARNRFEDRNRNPLIPVGTTPGQVANRDRRRDALDEEVSRCMAVQAWVRNQLGQDLTPEQRDAATAHSVNLNARDLTSELYRGDYRDVRAMREQRQQATTPGSAGGYTVPETMVRELEIALLDFSGVRQVADVMRTTGGGPMPWPTINDTGNMGAIVDENAQVTEQALVFGQVMFGAFKFSSLMVLLSQELIEDNAVNLVQQLGRLLGERIGRKQNEQFTVGDGTTGPQGITLAPSDITAASATAITADELIDLVHSVDPAYRAMSPSFQMNDQTLAAVRKLKDSQGQYLWVSGLAFGLAPTILGYPYRVNNDMPAMAANAVPVVFGAMQKYKIRDVAAFRLRRLVERYADYDQEGFVAFQRSDGKLLDAGTGPIKGLTMAAA